MDAGFEIPILEEIGGLIYSGDGGGVDEAGSVGEDVIVCFRRIFSGIDFEGEAFSVEDFPASEGGDCATWAKIDDDVGR